MAWHGPIGKLRGSSRATPYSQDSCRHLEVVPASTPITGSELATPHSSPQPRFPSLKAFGRRPQNRVAPPRWAVIRNPAHIQTHAMQQTKRSPLPIRLELPSPFIAATVPASCGSLSSAAAGAPRPINKMQRAPFLRFRHYVSRSIWPSQPGTSPAIPSILSVPANVRRAREPRNVRQYSLEHGWIGCREKRC